MSVRKSKPSKLSPKRKLVAAPEATSKSPAPAKVVAALDLAEVRGRIDAIDNQIQDLIGARARLMQQVGASKKAAGVAEFYRPEREAQVLRKVIERNSGPLSNA